jgi:S1-C subfamily serine protease
VWHSIRTISPNSSSSGGNSGNSGSNGFTSPFSGGSGGGTSGGGTSNSNSGPSDPNTIAAKVDPALVDINMTMNYDDIEGSGTGIVLTSNGLVLTNNHVVEGATSISAVDLGNGKTYGVTVLGYSRSQDISLVQLQGASGLTTASIGDSSDVTVGEQIVGVGNAGGVGGTPSAAGGSVTAVNQSITAQDEGNGSSEQLSNLIEVNANIQEGDSGGALINTSGQVVGMDTAAAPGFELGGGGQGYAIPINQVITAAHEISAGQASGAIHVGATAFLGVLVGSNGTTAGSSGVPLSSVISGTPAAQAGLAGGDYITSLGGQTISSPSDLTDLLVNNYRPGDRVQVDWVDASGQTHQATVQLASGPAQ